MIRFLTFFVFFISAVVLGEDTTSQKLFSVEFKNNKVLSTDDLNQELGIEKDYLFKDKKFSSKEITPMLDLLLDFYKSRGFIDTKIEVSENLGVIIFEIKEGQELKITSIEYKVPPYLNLKDIVKKSSLYLGSRFENRHYKETKENISNLLLQQGYLKNQVSIEPVLDNDSKTIAITISVETGEKYKIRNIKTNGLKTINQNFLTKYFKVSPNTDYNQTNFEETYVGILGLGVFEEVDVDVQEIDKNTVDLVFNLKEKSEFKYSFSVGVDSDSNIKLKTKISNNNFYGDLRNISLEGSYSTINQNILFKLEQPLDYKTIDFFNQLKIENKNYTSYKNSSIENVIGLSYNGHKLYHKFSLEDLEDFEQPSYRFYLSRVGYLFDYKKYDSLINPTKGYAFNFNYELSNPAIFSDFNYQLVKVKANYIYNFNNALIIPSFKYKKIFGQDKNIIPESELFFVGGGNGNRGLSLEDRLSNDFLLTNLELHLPILDNLKVVPFYDFTMDFQTHEKINSMGIGFRYKTMLGPIRIDFGREIKEHSNFKIHFGFGASF